MTIDWNAVNIKKGSGADAQSGFNAIIEAASSKITSSAATINEALATFDPTDPGQMLKIQQAMANYNLCLSVTSSMIKSFEDTAKSVAQKL